MYYYCLVCVVVLGLVWVSLVGRFGCLLICLLITVVGVGGCGGVVGWLFVCLLLCWLGLVVGFGGVVVFDGCFGGWVRLGGFF